MRKIFISIATLAIATVSMISMASRSESISLFDANVEDLASSESDGEIVKCYCKSSWFSSNVCSVNADGGYCGGDPCSNHDGNCR